MKKAIIATGGKQYLVAEGETISVELLKTEAKTAEFEPLLIIDGKKPHIGQPYVKGSKVVAEITEAEVKSDKVTAIRYKPKKRVHKIRGHRQKQTVLKITKIELKSSAN